MTTILDKDLQNALTRSFNSSSTITSLAMGRSRYGFRRLTVGVAGIIMVCAGLELSAVQMSSIREAKKD